MYVYVDVLNDVYSINQSNDDDYFKKLEEYKEMFTDLNNSLTYEQVLGLDRKVNVNKLTSRRITLQKDMYDTATSENRFY